MAIFKAKPANAFTQIPNHTLQDPSISFEAKGLLVLILSLPEDWEIHKTWLRDQSPKCGRDKLDKSFKELQEHGYMRKEVKRGEGGKLEGYDWYVYPEKYLQANEIKASTGTLKNRIPVKPFDGKPPTTNKHINKHTSAAANAEPANDGSTFDFQLILLWIVNQLTSVYQLTELDEIFIEASLHDYQDSATNPRRAQAFAWVEQGLAGKMGTTRRGAKNAAARDNLSSAVVNQIETQAAVIDQHTSNMQSRSMSDRASRSWDNGLELLEEA